MFMLQFTFCMKNIQCFSFRLDCQQWKRSFTQHFFISHPQRSPNIVSFSFLPVRMCQSLRQQCVLNEGAAMNKEPSCLVSGWLLTSCKLRYDYQPCGFRIHNTSQTHHPEHALEALGADDMWHAIMQIIRVNMTYFVSYETQFLSCSLNRLRHFHAMTSAVCVFKDLLCRADGMTTTASLHRESNKKGITEKGTWVTGLTLSTVQQKLPHAAW